MRPSVTICLFYICTYIMSSLSLQRPSLSYPNSTAPEIQNNLDVLPPQTNLPGDAALSSGAKLLSHPFIRFCTTFITGGNISSNLPPAASPPLPNGDL